MTTATTKQISQALGISKQAVAKRAKKEGWAEPTREGKSGQYSYRLAELPDDVRSALLDHAIATMPEKSCPLPVAAAPTALPVVIEKPDLPSPSRLKGWQREIMDARCGLLNYLYQLAQGHGTNKALDAMIDAARAGALPDGLQLLVEKANARQGQAGARTLSRSSLLRWKRALEAAEGNPAALAPKAAKSERIPAWGKLFLACYRKPSKPSVPEALIEMALIAPGVELPSEHQARRFLDKMSTVDREKGRRTGNDLRALKGYRKRTTDELLPCDVYQCDGHSFKARIAHPIHGKPFHPEVCAVIDAATRAVVGWSAGLSESNQTVADALRHGCMIDETLPMGGVPAIFYTDPGSGNLANVNADPILGRYARLGITFKTGIVGNSQARGLVERLQQTLWIKAAKQLPTYTGQDMDHTVEYKTTRLVDAQVKKTGSSEKLTSWPQFLDFCRQAVERYNHSPHSSLEKFEDAEGRRRHMTPAEAWAMHLAKGFVPPTLGQMELDDCFRPRVKVRTNRGLVRALGNSYYNGELEHHGGEVVWVEYEVQDGSKVWVRDQEERLICIARFEANASRMFPESAVDVARDERAKRRLALVERKAQEIREERQGVVEIGPSAEVIEATRAEFQQQIESERNVFELPTSPDGRLRLCRELQRRRNEGYTLSSAEKEWLGDYMQSSDYRMIAEMEREFNAAQK
ncbi:MAG: Mu transposase C-terminal domain-containing protein [Pigmentiphaga sp.]